MAANIYVAERTACQAVPTEIHPSLTFRLRVWGVEKFDDIQTRWKIRDLPNVVLHFANLESDMPDQKRKVVGFLEIAIVMTRWGQIFE